MIEGRMMVIGSTSPNCEYERDLPERLGVGVGVRPPERLGAGSAEVDHLLLDPVLAELLGAARRADGPRPARARCGPLSRSGRADRSDATRPRCRRAVAGPLAPRPASRLRRGTVSDSSSSSRASPLMGARRRRRSTPRGRWTGPARPSTPRARGRRPPRPRPGTGPSRLTSTAVSSGESKLTVAAEWTTTSHPESRRSPVLVEAEPVLPDVAGDGGDPGGDLLVEALAVARPGAGRSSRSAGSRASPAASASNGGPAGRAGRPRCREPSEQTLDEGGPEEPGATGDGEPPSGQRLTDRHRICLPYGKWTGREREANPVAGPGAGRGRSGRAARGGPPVTGVAPPGASSTRHSPRSPAGVMTPLLSTHSPLASTSASRPSSIGSRRKRCSSKRSSTALWWELSAAMEDALATAGSGWARVEAVVRSVFSLAARRPGAPRSGPRGEPPRHPGLDPVRGGDGPAGAPGRRSSSRPRWTPAICGGTSRSLLLLAIYSTVIGMVTEVEVSTRSARNRRRARWSGAGAEILALLRSALIADPT